MQGQDEVDSIGWLVDKLNISNNLLFSFRNMGNGWTLCVGRIGAILAPFMLYVVGEYFIKVE